MACRKQRRNGSALYEGNHACSGYASLITDNPSGPSYVAGTLPEGASDYVHRANPRLLELQRRYASYRNFQHMQWTPSFLEHHVTLPYFRGDNLYSWQVRGGMDETRYVLSAYYARSIDRLNLFDRLTEDNLFGAYTYDFNGKCISRDWLDSVLQLNFLERHIGLSSIPRLQVLDIGAGYGRMAWRLTEGLNNLETVWSTDAIAESTFLSEYYLTYRKAGPKAPVVPVDEAARTLASQRIDLVTNVQSFTECTLDSIEWWLQLLSTASVQYLMIVPNNPDRLLSMETDGTRQDFAPMLKHYGYRFLVRESCYEGAPSVQKLGVYGTNAFWLFGR